jgi:hypothetical protein
VKLLAAALLLVCQAAAQSRFEHFDRDLKIAAHDLHIADLRAEVLESGRVVWKNANITAPAPEEPAIAEGVPAALLDSPAPLPAGATIRQVLSNTADGTPGKEVLDNRSFFEALKPLAGHKPVPGAVEFASEDRGPLGWFSQDYAGQRILWSFDPSLIVVKVPAKGLALVVSANSTALTEAARLQDGNIVRSTIVLAFLKDVAGVSEVERDELINRALIETSATLTRQALDKFPELESTPDVSLLYLFARLGLPETEASATAVIRAHPALPTAWFYYGQYLENQKRYREAAACYEQITMHQPPWHNWTVDAARVALMHLQSR